MRLNVASLCRRSILPLPADDRPLTAAPQCTHRFDGGRRSADDRAESAIWDTDRTD
ncbi:MAG: hypothetical protein KDJ52_22060 [Anaerolineae bacterium]|nr:hypothetical protein [Anaerolineae bacterium]